MSKTTVLTTPCIEWTGCRSRHGYGRRRLRGRTWFAHRLAWVETHGPIPDGLNVLHRCDNPPCVNVDHLFLGTQATNMADMIQKGRHSAKLTSTQVDAIRADPRSQRAIAADYGLNQSSVSDIKRGASWR